jgi:lipoprotein-anchoring transpeptidase ErfK/SrfK
MENENSIVEGEHPETERHSPGTDNLKSETSEKVKPQGSNPFLRVLRHVIIVISTVVALFCLALYALYAIPAIEELTTVKKSGISSEGITKDPQYKKQLGAITKDIQKLTLKFNGYTSGQSYIVINTTENRFFLYSNKKLVREGFCSTGSLTMLKTEKGDKFWVFKTPKGKRSIHGKITNPSWNRPDWSFIEEGLPIPPKNSPARYESGVLGDYAMSIGDGYLIHGTIYKRFLGMPVTHGCVRLNDEDLEAVYHTLNIGSKVYIF